MTRKRLIMAERSLHFCFYGFARRNQHSENRLAMVAICRLVRGLFPGEPPAFGSSVGVRVRLYSGAAAATLRRCRLRLGLSRQHDQRCSGMARSTAGTVSFLLSANRTGGVSRDAQHAPAIREPRPGRLELP